MSSLSPYSTLPIGAGDAYVAPVAVPQRCLFLSPRTIDGGTTWRMWIVFQNQ